MGRAEPPPAERVRRRVAREAGPEIAGQLPSGYHRLGRVLLLRLPESLRPQFAVIGHAWRQELGVETVLRHAGETVGELRLPRVETIAGDGTVTEVVEHGIRYRLDAGQILFARGNRAERHRAGTVTRPGEEVADLFAGIGYFTLPALVHGRARRVWAVEKNPISFRYLGENAALNGVADRIEGRRGDNRELPLPVGAFDRVFLGYLPSAVPWVPRALELLRPWGGTVHVHLVADARGGTAAAEGEVVRAAGRAGASVTRVSGRVVKAYGPGRIHVVVDLTTGRPDDATG
jgi:tRNA wybutosine-synthesizing protein 2